MLLLVMLLFRCWLQMMLLPRVGVTGVTGDGGVSFRAPDLNPVPEFISSFTDDGRMDTPLLFPFEEEEDHVTMTSSFLG